MQRLCSPLSLPLLILIGRIFGGAAFFFACSFPHISQAQSISPRYQIEHLEPRSWWVGMRNTSLQIMVHGHKLAELSPSLHYPGVRIKKYASQGNPNYLFIDLEIAETASAGSFALVFSKAGKRQLSLTYTLQARRANSAQRQGFTPADAIYLLVPDRYANGDPSNDSQPTLSEKPQREDAGGRHGGDIAGIEQHLDYVSGLGFTMLWPTPLLENNQKTYSYHGYGATDFYQVDARFGSNTAYRELVRKAKQVGMGVIHDVVLNHIGIAHWWMQDLPSKDWLNFPNDYTETNHVRTTVQDPHAAQSDRVKFSSGWFVPSMPDLNQRNPYLATYLIQNTLWWIEYADLSGLRADTYSYSDKDFLARWSHAVMQEYPHMNIVGEEWSMNPSIVAYWQNGKHNQDGYRSYMPSMMDFSVYENLHTSLIDGASGKADLNKLYLAIANDFIYAAPENLTIFDGNHDSPRLFSELGEDPALTKMAMIMLATLRGIPQMYYGSEILMTSPTQRDDGKVRGDFPGGWKNDAVNAFTARGLSPTQKEQQDFVRTLFNWRKNEPVVHSGKMIHFVPENNCYVYFRVLGERKIMVLVNRNEGNLAIALDRFQEVIGNANRARDVLTQAMMPLEKTLAIAGKTALILELQTDM